MVRHDDNQGSPEGEARGSGTKGHFWLYIKYDSEQLEILSQNKQKNLKLKTDMQTIQSYFSYL